MASPNKVGGSVSFTIDGTQYNVRGNMEVSTATVKRELVVGQDGVHGYVETPVGPHVKCDLTSMQGLLYSTLEGIVDSTIAVALDNGNNYVLQQAFFLSGTVISAAEGRIACEFSGMSMEEYS